MGQDLLDPSFSQSEDPIVGHLGTSTEEGKKVHAMEERTSSHLPKNTGSHAPGSDSHSYPSWSLTLPLP